MSDNSNSASRPNDREHGSVHRTLGVDWTLDTDKLDAQMPELLQGAKQVSDTVSKPIKL